MITVLAPAKINFGLEILGKREDGYHELRTILCAISIFDTVEVDENEAAGLRVNDPTLETGNLVETAMDLIGRESREPARPNVTMRKRIPSAAGLGGASSDAGAALLAMQRLIPTTLDKGTMTRMASKLGSDVPFFLRTGLAMASGRGDVLTQLPHQRVDIVIASPMLSIAAKTATMYGLIGRADWSDGAEVERLAASLHQRESIVADEMPPNAFLRPLYHLAPNLKDFASRIRERSSLPVHVSGAGPAHYVVCRDQDHRAWVRDRLRDTFRDMDVRVLAGRSVPAVLMRAV